MEEPSPVVAVVAFDVRVAPLPQLPTPTAAD